MQPFAEQKPATHLLQQARQTGLRLDEPAGAGGACSAMMRAAGACKRAGRQNKCCSRFLGGVNNGIARAVAVGATLSTHTIGANFACNIPQRCFLNRLSCSVQGGSGNASPPPCPTASPMMDTGVPPSGVYLRAAYSQAVSRAAGTEAGSQCQSPCLQPHPAP